MGQSSSSNFSDFVGRQLLFGVRTLAPKSPGKTSLAAESSLSTSSTDLPLEVKALLRRGPSVHIEDVEDALEPFLESWRWTPQAAIDLKVLATYGFPGTACQLVEVLRRNQIGPNIAIYNSAIQASSQHGYWVGALHLMNSMRLEDVVPNVISYLTVIDACASSAWKFALATFGTSNSDSSELSLSSALNACDKGCQWHLAIDTLPKVRTL